MPIPSPKPGQDKDEFMGQCISFLKDEGKPQDQSVAICLNQWGIKNEMSDLLNKIDKLLIGDQSGATTTGDIATQTGKGKIDVIGMTYRKRKRKNKLGTETAVHEEDCPEGQKWCDKEGKCVPV